MSSDFFAQEPLPEKVFRGFIRRVTCDEPVIGCLISNQFWGCWVHFKGRSTGCLKSKEKCPGCKLAWPRKWLGYLFIRNEHTVRYEHLEVPFEAAHDLRDLVGQSADLAGTRIKARRHGGKKGKIKFELLTRIEDVAPDFKLPPDRDPGSILEYLWGVNYGKLKLFGDDPLPGRDAI